MEFNKISLEISDNIGIMRFNDPTVRNGTIDILNWTFLNG